MKWSSLDENKKWKFSNAPISPGKWFTTCAPHAVSLAFDVLKRMILFPLHKPRVSYCSKAVLRASMVKRGQNGLRGEGKESGESADLSVRHACGSVRCHEDLYLYRSECSLQETPGGSCTSGGLKNSGEEVPLNSTEGQKAFSTGLQQLKTGASGSGIFQTWCCQDLAACRATPSHVVAWQIFRGAPSLPVFQAAFDLRCLVYIKF